MSRYRPIALRQFKDQMDTMGFVPVSIPGTAEYVFERAIHNGHSPNRFAVRVYSSVDVRDGVTRDVGGDAIRIFLHDTKRDRPVTDWRVYRTENALENTRERARDAWKYALDAHHQCDCGSLMVQRKSKSGGFFGCTSFPECRKIKPLPKKQ